MTRRLRGQGRASTAQRVAGRPWRRSRWSARGGAAAPGRPRPAGRRPAASRSPRCAAAGARGSGPARPAAPAAMHDLRRPRRRSAPRCGACDAHEHAAALRRARAGRGAGRRRSPRRRRRAAAAARRGCPCRATVISPARQSMSSRPQRGDLAGAQPQPGQQQQDRVVAPPGRGAPVAAGQQRAAADPAPAPCGSPASRQPATDGTAPPAAPRSGPSTCRNRSSDRSAVTDQLRRPDAPARARGQHERGDLGRRQPAPCRARRPLAPQPGTAGPVARSPGRSCPASPRSATR